MFETEIYTQRRERLKKQLGSGVLLFLGNQYSPMNYPANPYHFRQDSSFLYFFGLDSSDLAGVIDVDADRDMLFGNDVSVDDIIWMGDQPLMRDRAAQVGITETFPLDKLEETIKETQAKGKKIHLLTPYRPESVLKLQGMLGIPADKIRAHVSEDLVLAVVEQRSIKIPEEVQQIELALEATYDMHTTAMTDSTMSQCRLVVSIGEQSMHINIFYQ